MITINGRWFKGLSTNACKGTILHNAIRFLRYIDTRPNGDALRKCILKGPYTPTIVTTPAVPATEDSPAVPEQTTVETVMNMTPENRAHFESEKEAIHLILTGIGDEIYSTVDACQTTQEMWEAIERLQQGESLNIQDVKTNLFWEFGQFTSHDGETIESYYTRFYKMMNEMIRNNLTVATMQVNVQFLQQLNPKMVKISFKEDSDPEQAQKDKDMQKNLALIAKYFKKLYKPTNNNLRTSSNTRNKNVDTTLRYKNDNQTGQFRNQRAVNVVGARETEVPNADSGTDTEPLEQVQYDTDTNVFANDLQHFDQSESISNTCVVETGDSNVIMTPEKHDELVKQSLLTKSHYEGLVKEKTKVITDLKLKEEKDIDKMISMENQLKFLNEIVYKRSQSIQTIHMLAPKCPTFNGRPTLPHPKGTLKKAQNKIPCLYAIPHDQSDPANRLVPDREETLTLDNESRSKLNKDLKIVDQAWVKTFQTGPSHLRNPTAQDMEILVKTCLMPLALKTQNDSFAFVHELKQEMHADLKYVESLEDELDELESNKAEFSTCMIAFAECVSKECDCLAQKLSEQTEFVRVAHKTNVSRPQPRSNQMKDKVVPNTSQVKFKKTEVEGNPGFSSISKSKQCMTACKTVLKSELSIVKIVRRGMVDMHKQCPSHDTWVPKDKKENGIPKVGTKMVILDCTKHMTGNLSLLCNFIEKYMGTVRFGNDQFAPILGLNHNLFSVGQFCDADLEVAFRKSTCFVRDLQGNDLLTDGYGIEDFIVSTRLINLAFKKDVVIGLPKLKYVKDQLCSSCEVSKAKRSSFKSKTVPSSKGRLNLLHMDLCGPMRVASINGKKYILVIVDDYSRYTWTLFLRSKDETPEVLMHFLTMDPKEIFKPSISVRTDRGTEFLNKTLNAFFKEEGIEHQTSTPRTPEQNGVVERRNRTLVEAARTMLSASKLPLFFWAEGKGNRICILK
ncbi:retrovirus-related pol polyprotein from transposon TNT 1-94 [Tanacetum coccineum]